MPGDLTPVFNVSDPEVKPAPMVGWSFWRVLFNSYCISGASLMDPCLDLLSIESLSVCLNITVFLLTPFGCSSTEDFALLMFLFRLNGSETSFLSVALYFLFVERTLLWKLSPVPFIELASRLLPSCRPGPRLAP